jgi:hypothetical protein
MFAQACGQELAPVLRTQTERLRRLGELRCSDEVAAQLTRMSASTIRHCAEFCSPHLTGPSSPGGTPRRAPVLP